MTGRMLLTLVALTFAFSTPIAVAAGEQTYQIDSEHTYPNFTLGHLGISTIHGQFNDTRGTIVMDRTGDKSKVDITITAASIYTANTARDKALKHWKGFFDVDKYPTITYKSTNVKFEGQHRATVQGKLTMHGVTKPVTLNVNRIRCKKNPLPVEQGKYTCGFNAQTSLKRSDYGITAFLPVVGDTVDIRLEVEADRSLSENKAKKAKK